MRLVLALALSGCSVTIPSNPDAAVPPDASVAAEIVWDTLGQAPDKLPAIHWVEGPCIDYPHSKTDCIAGGLYLPDLHEVWVIPQDTISSSALAHELVHAAGVPDEAEARIATTPLNAVLRGAGL